MFYKFGKTQHRKIHSSPNICSTQFLAHSSSINFWWNFKVALLCSRLYFAQDIHCLFHGSLPMGGWHVSIAGMVMWLALIIEIWLEMVVLLLNRDSKSHSMVNHHQFFFLLTRDYFVLDEGCFFILGSRMKTMWSWVSPDPTIDMRNKPLLLWATKILWSLLPHSPNWWKNH